VAPVAEMLAVVEPPAALAAVTVIVLTPPARGIGLADHPTIAVPGLASVAAPEPPRSLTQVTAIPPMEPDTEPSSLRADEPDPEFAVIFRMGFRRADSACAVGDSAAAASIATSLDVPPPHPTSASALTISANATTA
jgi:hypothetical protein